MALKKGRPTEGKIEDQPVKFDRTFKYNDGISVTEHWDLRKSKNGPMSVDITYPKNYQDFDDIQENLPKTRRQYVNPENGRTVGYSRAKSLGLID